MHGYIGDVEEKYIASVAGCGKMNYAIFQGESRAIVISNYKSIYSLKDVASKV